MQAEFRLIAPSPKADGELNLNYSSIGRRVKQCLREWCAVPLDGRLSR